MATHPVFLPGEFHGQRSLVGHSRWGRKEMDTTKRLTHTHMKPVLSAGHCPGEGGKTGKQEGKQPPSEQINKQDHSTE